MFAAILFSPIIALAQAQPVMPLDGFAPVDLARWTPGEAGEPLALVEPLTRGYPASAEGRPALRIEFLPRGDGAFLIEVERTGFTDDSVNGDQHRLLVRRVGAGWRVEAVGRRHRCWPGRGSTDWTTRPCA